MAFSKKQYENFIRTIVVAAVAKEFRRAKIIEKTIERAKQDGKVATGGLIRPDVTGSMIPTRDDRWLLDRKSVTVNVGKVVFNVPLRIDVSIAVEYGVDKDYVYTRKDIEAKYPKGSLPNVNNIKTWIVAKTNKGLLNFKYRGKPLDVNNDKQLSRAAYVVMRSIARKGISEKYKSNYFKPVRDEVEKTLQAALQRASERIFEKYSEDVYNSTLDVLDVNIV